MLRSITGHPGEVHFIQFMFPDGERINQWVERTPEIADKARALWAAGFSLEIENFCGHVWMSAVRHSTNESVDRHCNNGPEVPAAVDSLIDEAYAKFILK